jgi:hypothetical protein
MVADNKRVPHRLSRLALCIAVVAAILGAFALAGVGPAGASAAPDSPAGYTGVDGTATPTDFWLATAVGNVWSFGDTCECGAAGSAGPLDEPIVGIIPTQKGSGYWEVASDGGIFTFGDAAYFGSLPGAGVHATNIVGMVPTPDGQGYWLVGSDGGIFGFGDAAYFGSVPAMGIRVSNIVGMAPTSDGKGYWLVGSDGGIFGFGDAGGYGSIPGLGLHVSNIVAMTPTSDGLGYWLVASGGGVFTFGGAGFYGSMGGVPTSDPAEKLVASPGGGGYWIFDQNGTAHAFGSASGTPPRQGLMFDPVTPGDKAVLFAFYQLGKPYIWGGNGPVGYDCSGLALASWEEAAGVSFARVSDDQYHTAGTAVTLSDLAAGDLVFWGSSQSDWTSVYHTGIYVGGGRIVEATGDQVQLNSLSQWGGDDLMPNGRRP